VEKFAGAIGLKQGGWRTSLKLLAAEVEALPGADPALVARTKARIAQRLGTVDEIDECSGHDSLASLRLPGILVEPGCSVSRMEAGDGRWAIAAACPAAGERGPGGVVAQGTYSPGTVTGRHDADLSHKGVIVHAKVETVSRFVGECRPPPPVATPTAPEPEDD
jgi:hypothetical protein